MRRTRAVASWPTSSSTPGENDEAERVRRDSPRSERFRVRRPRPVPLAQPRAPGCSRGRGDRERRRTLARDAVTLASLTDAPPRSRARPPRSRRGAAARGQTTKLAREATSAAGCSQKGATSLARRRRKPGVRERSPRRSSSPRQSAALSLRRRCRRLPGMASAWRTSFRAPTVERGPNGPVTTP